MSNLDPVVQIGDWYYQVIYGQLWPASAPTDSEQMIRLEPRLHSLLNFFLLNPNKLLAKDTLIEKVWPVEEGTDAAVMRAVGALRKVLGDDVRSPSYIATVSKKGYCWLADIKAANLQQSKVQHSAAEDNLASAHQDDNAQSQRWPWRFIVATAVSVAVVCASLAYVLAKFTANPMVKLPDTISPISALSGQEYWPALSPEQTHVVYQHKPPQGAALNWSVQSLADLRVEHSVEQYTELSQPLWLDTQHIIFRGRDNEGQCYFFLQQLLPQANEPAVLWSCQQVLPQALQRWQQQWLWLDLAADNSTMQLWSAAISGEKTLLATMPFSYRKVEHMLLRDDSLYLLAQQTQNNSVLIKMLLPDGKVEQIADFPLQLEQLSWWDKSQLLLASRQQALQIYDLRSGNMQGLGPLTRELTQAVRHSDQVLATQFLDYTTDILQLGAISKSAELIPWHVSNRSERLIAVSEQQTAFVSERAGHSQIWLADGANSSQLTRLTEQQQVQQLLWHNNDLLVLINSQLYQLLLNSTALSVYPQQAEKPGRYASCANRLYWTELTGQGWALFVENGTDKTLLQRGVVDVRCAPQQQLVLQFAVDTRLQVLTTTGSLKTLPVAIDWRQLNGEQWFVDDTGIYWLNTAEQIINRYDWQSEQVHQLPWTQQNWPVAIYSNGAGLGYIVRPRPHDTDIIWLQNRR
uniref:Transcriptional regulatory protein, C-terminal n=1 Tax=Rheinheimera sp. BAL341 TaxID=1708203 RepID=A0A486XV26_9GAMM